MDMDMLKRLLLLGCLASCLAFGSTAHASTLAMAGTASLTDPVLFDFAVPGVAWIFSSVIVALGPVAWRRNGEARTARQFAAVSA